MIMAIFALSLDLLVGHTGLVSLGHAAYFGVAAYALALISPKYEAANLWLTLPAAMAVAALAALIIGFLVVRTAGVYFIMVTLAFAQMLYSVFHDTKLGGGSDGIYIYVRPELTIAGFKPLDIENPVQFYYFVLILLVAVYAFYIECCTRPSAAPWPAFGSTNSACALSASRLRVQARRVRARRRARGAGRLSRRLPIRFRQSRYPRLATIRSRADDGHPRRYGPVTRRGARRFFLRASPRNFSAPALLGAYAKHWQLGMGGLIVMIVLVFPHGIGGFLDIALRRISYRRPSGARTDGT